MTPYYERDGITILCGDCRELLPRIGNLSGAGDVILTDPPYDAKTHAGARTNAGDGVIHIDFAPADVEWTGTLWQYAVRWTVAFCALEQLGEYRRVSGEAWIRGGFYRRTDGAPQISGDRPAQPGEGLAIMHRPGKKRWNGHGMHAYWEGQTVKRDKVHPTQKPEALMRQLVQAFSDPGEVIIDPFMGSGTTLVAAQRLGRKAIGIEIDERYCAAAVERLQQTALCFAEAE